MNNTLRKKWLFDATFIRKDSITRGIQKVIEDLIEVVVNTDTLLKDVNFIVEKKNLMFFIQKFPKAKEHVLEVRDNFLKFKIFRGVFAEYRYTINFSEYSFYFTPFYMTILTRCAIPQVAIIYDLIIKRYFFQYITNERQIGNFVYFLLLRFKMTNISKVNQIIAISEYTKRDVHKNFGIPVENINVIPLIKKDPPKSDEVIRQSIIKMKGFRIILYVGGFDYRKNLFQLITIFKNQKLYNDFNLVIAGTASEKEYTLLLNYSRKINTENKVHIFKNLNESEIEYLYRISFVFACVSLYEGFGLPLIEAMGKKLPVVAFANSAVQEVVGDFGVLVENGNEVMFGQVILKILEDEEFRLKLIEKGLQRSSYYNNKQFSESVIKLFDYYKEIFN